mmetsp:Transcript_23454/g.79450  ORF Transcript_23454/g.79450 Transcript_23454/m.79450 type:complete len:270 (-) Transcript_23454:541-1350(-)
MATATRFRRTTSGSTSATSACQFAEEFKSSVGQAALAPGERAMSKIASRSCPLVESRRSSRSAATTAWASCERQARRSQPHWLYRRSASRCIAGRLCGRSCEFERAATAAWGISSKLICPNSPKIGQGEAASASKMRSSTLNASVRAPAALLRRDSAPASNAAERQSVLNPSHAARASVEGAFRCCRILARAAANAAAATAMRAPEGPRSPDKMLQRVPLDGSCREQDATAGSSTARAESASGEASPNRSAAAVAPDSIASCRARRLRN